MCTHPRSSKLFSIESRSCNSYSDVSHRDASVNNTVRSIATRVNPNPNPNLNPTLTLTLTLTICRQLTICFLFFSCLLALTALYFSDEQITFRYNDRWIYTLLSVMSPQTWCARIYKCTLARSVAMTVSFANGHFGVVWKTLLYTSLTRKGIWNSKNIALEF